jgi:hypothetical protein
VRLDLALDEGRHHLIAAKAIATTALVFPICGGR